MRNSNDCNVFDRTLERYCRVFESYCKFLCKFCLDSFQYLAVINFNVTFQHRFPTHNLSLAAEENGNAVIPTLSMWTSILDRLFCPCLKLMPSSQLSSDLVKHIITRVLMSWNLLVRLVLWQVVDLIQQPQGFALTKCLREVMYVQQE